MKRVLFLLTAAVSLFAEEGFRTVNGFSGSDGGISIREIGSDALSRTYEYRVDPVNIGSSPKAGYSSLDLGSDAKLSVVGKPAIPYLPQTFLVPQGMTIDSVSLNAKESSSISLTEPVEYAASPFVPGSEIPETEIDETIYSSTEPFPARKVEIASVQKSSGVSIAFVNIFPLQFIGKTNELLSIGSFEITLHFSQQNLSRSVQTAPVFPNRVDAAQLGIENPEELDRYRAVNSRSSAEAQFVIITGNEFLNAIVPNTVKDLAERRRKEGMTVKIVTTDSIYNAVNQTLDHTPDGEIDRQMKIRYFLSEAHRNWGTEYVLIAGDTNVVPVRILDPNFGHTRLNDKYDFNIPSDYYYQCLDGAYNSLYKNEHVWGSLQGAGEVIDTITDPYGNTVKPSLDILPELHLGRVPAETPLEFSNWLNKQFAYESIPYNDSRHNDVLFAGEYLGFFALKDIWGIGNPLMYAKKSLEEIHRGSNEEYTTKGFSSVSSIQTETIYDQDRVNAAGGNSDTVAARWGREEILEKINSNNYSLIQHLGHSLPKLIMHLTNTDVKNVKNSRPLMLYSQSCLAGRFTEDCIGEKLLTDSDTSGLWAAFLNTGYGYADNDAVTTDGYVQRINRNFWHGYFKEDPIVKLGKLNSYGRSGLFSRAFQGSSSEDHPTMGLYSIFSMSLFGDPTANLRLLYDAPQNYLFLTSPVGGRTVALNKSQKITWSASEDEQVTLSLLSENGTVIEVGQAQSSAAELIWTPADYASAGTGYRMIIKGAATADTSAAFELSESVQLEIVDYPSEGINKGETVYFSWNSDDSLVSVWIMRDGAPVVNLAEATSESSIEWTVPDNMIASKNYTVKIIGSNSRDRFAESPSFELFSFMVNTFPFVEDFQTGKHKSYEIPSMWNQSEFDDFDWAIFAGMTPIKAECLTDPALLVSGPSVDFSTGTDTGKHCIMISRLVTARNKKAELVSPVFDLRGCSNVSLSFGLHMYSSNAAAAGTFTVSVRREGKADSVIFYQDTVISEDKWVKKEVSLADFDGEMITLLFEGVTGHTYASDIAIDDITVSVGSQDLDNVSVINENSNRPVMTNELVVIPSVVTADISVAKIYHKERKPFSYRWGLYNAVGDLLESGEGDYSGNGNAVDYIDISRFHVYTGATVLFLRAVDQNGKVTIHKTSVGFKK